MSSQGYLRGQDNLMVINSDSSAAHYDNPEQELSATTPTSSSITEQPLNRVQAAKMMGYEGDACPECSSFTLLRNGTCLKCDTCGATTGCS